MSAPDPIVAGVAVGATLEAAKQAQDFIAAILGKPGQSLGSMVGGYIKVRRLENVGAIAAMAAHRIFDIGEQPIEIPLRIAAPALEAASMEDDPDLQERWANLLANAADPRQLTPIGPMFSYMLRDLGPREVKFLDTLYDKAVAAAEVHPLFHDPSQISFSLSDLRKVYGELGFSPGIVAFDQPTFEEQQKPGFNREMNAFWLMLDIIQRDIVRDSIIPPDMKVYSFSDLGVAFVKACRRPEKSNR